jgi:hypothetical protein
MARRYVPIAIIIVAFLAFLAAPRAKADPLTVIAVVGIATVTLLSTADQTLHEHEDDRDMRAKQDDEARAGRTNMETSAASPASSSLSGKSETAAQ